MVDCQLGFQQIATFAFYSTRECVCTRLFLFLRLWWPQSANADACQPQVLCGHDAVADAYTHTFVVCVVCIRYRVVNSL